ncbi:MAG TPA: apolipoprotein N-acyltransferase [Beijerinckiaceae bacterium]|nr:apolipoprotein N-acyltransferase [Beijerinckiaceae bacterium]
MIDRVIDISHAVILSEGWRRRMMAFAAGALGALAAPPVGAFPVLALSFPIAIWLLDGCTAAPGRYSAPVLRQAAGDGWWFGFGYFLAGLWWIGAAFLVETDEFAWAIPLGVIGLPAALAMFVALGFALARLLWSPGLGRIFAFAFGLGVAEWLRHWLFTGFPWNGFGHGLGNWLVTAQAASLIGAEGLAMVSLVVFALPATVVDAASRRPWRATLFGLSVLGVLVAFGVTRLLLAGGLAAQVGPEHVVDGVRLRLVQPNISQRDKHTQRDGHMVLTRLLTLSDRSTGPTATGMADSSHLVWPESPFPFVLSRDQRAMAELARQLPPKATLLTGAVRLEEGAARERRFFNTLHVITGRDGVLRSYDKQHLVPFGEYLPLEAVLSTLGLRRFVHAPGAFAVGSPRQLLEVAGLPPVLPLICYEAIFPLEILGRTPRPGLLLNITNDAWFGETFGPHQHFAQARLRAIEFGLPLVRAANTGISAVVDGYGRQVATIPLGAEGIADAPLPKPLTTTAYWSHGNELRYFFLLLSMVLAVGIGPISNRFRKRTQARTASKHQ